MSEVSVVVGLLYLDLARSLSSTGTLFVTGSRYSHYWIARAWAATSPQAWM